MIKVILFILICLPYIAHTSELSTLIDKAMKDSPSIKALKYHADSLKASVSSSGSYEDPVLTYQESNVPVGTRSFNLSPMSGKKISLSQKINFPGKLTKKQNIANLKYQSALHQYKHNKFNTVLKIKKSYYRLFLEVKKKYVITKQKNLIKQLTVSARSKYTLGKTPQTEIINFQMEETGLISQLLISERKIKVEKNTLANLIGSVDTKLSVNPKSLDKTYLNFKKINLKSISNRVLKNNHNLKSHQLIKDSSKESLTLAKLEYLPDFNLRYTRTMREANPVDSGTDFNSAMVSVNLPLWGLTKESNNVEAARQNKLKAHWKLKEQQIYLTNKVHHIYTELEESYKTLTLYENTLLPLAKQAVRSGKSSYLSGRVEYSTLLNSISKRFDTEFLYYKSLTKYETLIAELELLLAEPI